jgi:hypothetical protein
MKGKYQLEDPGVDERITLKFIFKRKSVRCGLDSYDSRQCPVADSCEHANEPSGSIKAGIYYRLLKESIRGIG